jgi:hypothetical protein
LKGQIPQQGRGKAEPASASGQVQFDTTGKALRLIGIAQGIGERKRARGNRLPLAGKNDRLPCDIDSRVTKKPAFVK